MAEVELNDIMSSFEANNCQTIPNKLLEYQIFNQPYYTGRILRLLLAPRQVPSPPDTRERLIEALKKRDKSHQSMFAKYERECKKLNNSTSNGEGSSSSKMLLMYSPLEEKLERLKRHYEDNEDQLGPILSQVSTAINQAVSDIKKSIINNNDKSSKKHSGDLCSPGLKEWEIQVVELLLKYVTEIIIKISLPLHESEADITDKQ
ncbi:PREDICTED: Fanconi anemia group A protein-like [Amphimedon queenslandica]|nr:PREDICTED: Fanconi anemia group A protein-like [Amphimedon queenslandica]|eukprot:XP_019859802.1 PREDICTED: Fanconi anemia group A protein-like [Amphimedon queenslandica]